MKSTLLWALVILNGILLVLFVGRVSHENSAAAQPAPSQRRALGDYVTISGDVNGSSGGLVYVLDTSNDLLGAMAYDDTRGVIDDMPVIDLKPIFAPAPMVAPVRPK